MQQQHNESTTPWPSIHQADGRLTAKTSIRLVDRGPEHILWEILYLLCMALPMGHIDLSSAFEINAYLSPRMFWAVLSYSITEMTKQQWSNQFHFLSLNNKMCYKRWVDKILGEMN